MTDCNSLLQGLLNANRNGAGLAGAPLNPSKTTAVFFSGKDQNGTLNSDLAKECTASNSSAYTLNDTYAGQYFNDVIDPAYRAGEITPTQYYSLGTEASQLFAQAARGDAIAFIDGALPGTTFDLAELGSTILLGQSGVTSINGTPVSLIQNAYGNSNNFQAVKRLIVDQKYCFANDTIPPTGGAVVTPIDNIQNLSANPDATPAFTVTPIANTSGAVSPFTVGEAIGVGALVAAGLFTPVGKQLATQLAAKLLLNPATVRGAVALLVNAVTAEQAPAAPSTSNPISQTTYQDEVNAYNASELSAGLVELRADVCVADGLLSTSALGTLPNLTANFTTLETALQANGGTFSGAIALPSGQQINVSAMRASNGNITYTESAAAGQNVGSDLLSNGGNSAIASQSDVFNSAGMDISNVVNFTTGDSQRQTFTYAGGNTTQQNTGYSGSNGTGTQLYQQSTTTSSTGAVSASISGSGDNADLSNAAITLAPGAIATINGDGNTINGGAGSLAIVNFSNGTSVVEGFHPVQIPRQVTVRIPYYPDTTSYFYDGDNYYGGPDGNGVVVYTDGTFAKLTNFSTGHIQFGSPFQSYTNQPVTTMKPQSQIVQQSSHYSGTNGTGSLQSYNATSQNINLDANSIAALVNGSVTGYFPSLIITSSASNIAANLDALQAIDSALGSAEYIILTDSGTPTLALTEDQALYDMSVLGEITSHYNETVSGVKASDTAFILAQPHVTGISVNDNAFSVAANSSALQNLATSRKLNSITVSDTGANVVANLDTLQTLATGAIPTSITLTDSTTPTLALTSAQATNDAGVLGKITSPYYEAVSDVTAANAASVAAASNVSITVTDTTLNVWTNLDALQTLASSGKLTAINLPTGKIHTIILNAAQASADALALSKIVGSYNETVLGVTAANAATVAAGTYVVGITVSDTAANVFANLDSLQTLATSNKLGSITLTDTTPQTLTLTAGQAANDAGTLGKITTPFTQVIAPAASNGQIATTISGQGNVVNLTNATITLTSGTQATINGTSNTIVGTTGDTVSIAGDGLNIANIDNVTMASSTVNIAASSMANIIGNADTINALAGDSFGVTGNGDTVNAVAGVSFGIAGTNNTFNLTGDAVFLNGGASNTVNSNNSTITLAANTNATVNGTVNTISGTTADTVNISDGTNTANIDNVTMAFSTVNIAANSTANITGNSNTINAGTNDSFGVTGNGVTVNAVAGTNFGISGTNETLNVSGDVVNIAANSTVTINGVNNTITGSAGSVATVNNTNGSSYTDAFLPTASISQQLNNYSGANATGSLQTQYTNWTFGGSTAGIINPSSIIAVEYDNYSGANETGTLTSKTINLVAGGSTYIQYNPTNAITQTTSSYTGAGDTGTLTSTTTDWTAGGSQQELFNPNGSILLQFNNYSGLDDTGVLQTQYTNWSFGGSVAATFNPSSTVAVEYDNYSGANETGTLTSKTINWVAGGSQQELFNPNGSILLQFNNYSGLNDTGVLQSQYTNWSFGGSVAATFNPSSTVTVEYDNYSGANETGTLTSKTINLVAGGSQYQQLTGLFVGISLQATNYGGANDSGNVLSTLLYGDSGNDTLSVTASNETLVGNGGYDTYKVSSGYGATAIQNGVFSNTGSTGELDFCSGLTDNRLWFLQTGNNLQIDIMGTNNSVTIDNWFSNSSAQLQEIKDSTGVMIDAQVSSLVSAMAYFSAHNSGFNPTAAANATITDSQVLLAVNQAWH